jgi:hypothetical protein
MAIQGIIKNQRGFYNRDFWAVRHKKSVLQRCLLLSKTMGYTEENVCSVGGKLTFAKWRNWGA